MNDSLTNLELILNLSPVELEGIETTIDVAADATDYTTHDLTDACEVLAFYGFDASEIMATLPSIALFADRQDAEIAPIAGTLPHALHAFGLEAIDAASVLAQVDQTVIDHPVTAYKVLKTLERVGPVATHNGFPLAYCLEMIGEVSRTRPLDRRFPSHVEDRIYEEVFDGE